MANVEQDQGGLCIKNKKFANASGLEFVGRLCVQKTVKKKGS